MNSPVNAFTKKKLTHQKRQSQRERERERERVLFCEKIEEF
jgi:hypothetical protein